MLHQIEQSLIECGHVHGLFGPASLSVRQFLREVFPGLVQFKSCCGPLESMVVYQGQYGWVITTQGGRLGEGRLTFVVRPRSCSTRPRSINAWVR